ncbi:MAG: GNAT family N-acetyltransferase [Candidatus Omnitrophica bacterium]|nr:GNAT family N-acetyltransferase [Candidatus Omnitrophota bacterium]
MAHSFVEVNELRVRPFLLTDRLSVRQIALSTAMSGSASSAFFDGDDFLADALTLYFTDHEPQSCFVLEQQGTVAGYILGACSTLVMDVVFSRQILLPLIGKALIQGLLLRRKNLAFLYQVMMAALSGRLWAPDFSRDYPATLHINIALAVRGHGAGALLMRAYLEYLSQHGVVGVRMATMSEAAGRFFERQGFKLLYRSSRPYFHHILGVDVPLLIYGKRLR